MNIVSIWMYAKSAFSESFHAQIGTFEFFLVSPTQTVNIWLYMYDSKLKDFFKEKLRKLIRLNMNSPEAIAKRTLRKTANNLKFILVWIELDRSNPLEWWLASALTTYLYGTKISCARERIHDNDVQKWGIYNSMNKSKTAFLNKVGDKMQVAHCKQLKTPNQVARMKTCIKMFPSIANIFSSW